MNTIRSPRRPDSFAQSSGVGGVGQVLVLLDLGLHGVQHVTAAHPGARPRRAAP